MPKSYKILNPHYLDSSKLINRKVAFGNQNEFEGMPTGPTTKIYRSPDKVSTFDFQFFKIEHELEETATGRVDGRVFNKFIRMGIIDAFYSEQKTILLLSGKKRDVLDFCRKYADDEILKFTTNSVDMAKLLSLLPNVKGVWFSFPKGQVKASALMGHNLENTPDFKNFHVNGEMSTLSFEFEHGNVLHPIMITGDGAIVLYGNYTSRSEEIDLAVSIKDKLLESVLTKDSILNNSSTSHRLKYKIQTNP